MSYVGPCSHRELTHLSEFGSYQVLSRSEIQAVCRGDLGEALTLWLWLRGAFHTGESGTIERTWKEIGRAIGRPESTIRKWGQKLEKLGYIEIVRRKCDDKMNMANIFRACLPGMVASNLIEGLKHRRVADKETRRVEKDETVEKVEPSTATSPTNPISGQTPAKEAESRVYTVFPGSELEMMAAQHGLPAPKAQVFREATGRLEEGRLVLFGNKTLIECFLRTMDFAEALKEKCGATSLRVVQGLLQQQSEPKPAESSGRGQTSSEAGIAQQAKPTGRLGRANQKPFTLPDGMPNSIKQLVLYVREHLERMSRWVYSRSREEVAKEIVWQIHNDEALKWKKTDDAIRMCLALVRKEKYQTPYGLRNGMALKTAFYEELLA